MIITNTFGKNVNFKNQRRKNRSYNGHVKQCFNIKENRNKETLKKFEDTIRNYIESSETMKINGSYRQEIPAYRFKKPKENLIITVNATNSEFVSVRNATKFQLKQFEINNNLGFDTRPSMELKLRGPKQ